MADGDDLPLWEDDPFVRSTLRELAAPDHQPDFWDHLAGALDTAADAAGYGQVAPVRRLPTRPAAEPHPPRTAPLRAAPKPTKAKAAPAATPAAAEAVAPPRSTARVFVPAPEVDAAPAAAAALAPSPAPAPSPPTAAAPPARPRPEVEVVHDLALVPDVLRRPGNVAMAVLAVAAAVVVVVAGTTLVRQRTDDGGSETASIEDATQTSFVAEGVAGADDPAAEAVLAWIAAIDDGDADEAWDALAAGSKRAFGDDQDDFEATLDDLADDLGAWAGTTPDRVVVTPVTASDEGTLSVVTLVGTIDDEPRADAFPVRVLDGEAQLEPFADAGPIDFITPAPGDTADPDDEVVVQIPAGVGAPIIVVGSSGPARCGDAGGTTLRSVGSGSKQECTFVPGGGDPTGDRVVTVAFTSFDGSAVSARSMRYQAA